MPENPREEGDAQGQGGMDNIGYNIKVVELYRANEDPEGEQDQSAGAEPLEVATADRTPLTRGPRQGCGETGSLEDEGLTTAEGDRERSLSSGADVTTSEGYTTNAISGTQGRTDESNMNGGEGQKCDQ